MESVSTSVQQRAPDAPRADHWDTGWRRLPHVLLERPAHGAWRCELPGRRPVEVADGHLLVLPRACMHRLVNRPTAAMRSSWCHCDWWQVPGLPLPLPTRPLVLPPTPAALLDDILTAGTDLAADLRRQRALLQLLEAISAAEPATQAPRIDPRIAAVLGWCSTHCHRPIGRNDLARVAGLSPTRLHALFKQELGQAPMQWLAAHRLARAAQLLLGEPETGIGVIAERCGFSSPYWFSRAFAAAHDGQSPSRWRQAVLSGRHGAD